MAKKDEVDQTNLGVSSADIPDLKKKDKERKRGGMAWGGSSAPGGTFQGARAAASAASSAAGGAQAGAGLVAKIAALSLAGKGVVVMAAVVVMGAAALVGTALLGGGGGGGAVSSGTGSFSLGGIASSVKVRSGGSDRLGVAGKGEIAFDPVEKAKPAEKKVAQDQPVEASPATDAPSPADMAKEAKEAAEAQGKLAHNLSGAQLSGSLGGQFGGKNIFSGSGSSAPKFGENAAKYTAKGGKLAPMRAGGVRATASGRSTSRGRTSRALGQLRIARGLSTRGAGSTSVEGASGGATDAFEQNAGDGGTLTSNGSAAGGGTAGTSGAGGSGSGGTADVTVPDTITIDDVQDALDNIKDLTDEANDLKSSGNMLLIIGGVITAVGIGLTQCSFPYCVAIGLVLICIGLGVMMAGYSKLQQADAKKEEAEAMGDALASRTGEFQSEVVRECVELAIAGGTSLDTCRSVEAEERSRLVEEQNRKALERQKEISAETPETF